MNDSKEKSNDLADTEPKPTFPLLAYSSLEADWRKKIWNGLSAIILSIVLGLIIIRLLALYLSAAINSSLTDTALEDEKSVRALVELFNSPFKFFESIASEHENPVSLLVELYGLVVTIMVASAFQSKETIDNQRWAKALALLNQF